MEVKVIMPRRVWEQLYTFTLPLLYSTLLRFISLVTQDSNIGNSVKEKFWLVYLMTFPQLECNVPLIFFYKILNETVSQINTRMYNFFYQKRLWIIMIKPFSGSLLVQLKLYNKKLFHCKRIRYNTIYLIDESYFRYGHHQVKIRKTSLEYSQNMRNHFRQDHA